MPFVFSLRKKSTSSFDGRKKPRGSGVSVRLSREPFAEWRMLRGVPLIGGLLRVDAHLVPGSVLVLELHDSVDQRVDGEISAKSNVAAGMPLRSALADDDVAGDDLLTAELFHAAVLRVAVASVSGRADALFMCHENSFIRA